MPIKTKKKLLINKQLALYYKKLEDIKYKKYYHLLEKFSVGVFPKESISIQSDAWVP